MAGPKYPKGERVWTGYYNRKGELLFILTSKELRDQYFLYELVDGEFKKLGKNPDPSVLVSRFKVEEKMKE